MATWRAPLTSSRFPLGALLLGLSAFSGMACDAGSSCLDAGADGGCFLVSGAGGGTGGGGGGGSGGAFDPSQTAMWDLVLESFSADVSITGLSVTDMFCSISGGTVTSAFTHAPAAAGTVVGRVSYVGTNAGGPSGSVWIEFDVHSDGSVSARDGTATGTGAVHCDAEHDTFDTTYRMTTDFAFADGPLTLSATMPMNPFVGGNIACLPSGDRSCDLRFFQSNDPDVHRTAPLQLSELVSGSVVSFTFDRTASNEPSPGETRTGDYHWSGELRVRAVRR